MNPRVVSVLALPDHHLELAFSNGETRIFDLRPHLTLGVFKRLTDPLAFQRVVAVNGTVSWPGDIDICPDTLYESSCSAHEGLAPT